MASVKESLAKSGKGVLDERAQILSDSIRVEADRELADYRSKVLKLKSQIANLDDLSVESRDSLRPAGKEFDSSAWVKKSIELRKQLRVATIEYQLVQKWYDEKFPAKEVAEIEPVEEEVE